MAYCAYCNVDLPGEESICRKCSEVNAAPTAASETAEAQARRWAFWGVRPFLCGICVYPKWIHSTVVLTALLSVLVVGDAIFSYKTSRANSVSTKLLRTLLLVALIAVTYPLATLRHWRYTSPLQFTTSMASIFAVLTAFDYFFGDPPERNK